MSSSEIQSAADVIYDTSCSGSTYSESSDESDEPPTPPRSPSRLDFCSKSYEEDYKWYDSDITIPLLWNAADEHRPSRKAPHQENTEADDICDDPVEYLIRGLVSGMQDPLRKEPETHSPSQGDPVSDTAPNVPPSTHSFGPLSTAERLQLIRGKRQREPCHHGLSRNALSFKKTLWDSRLDKWRALYNQASAWQHHATGDLAQPTSVPPSGLERDIPQRASRWYAYDLQSPIYPRAGDIPALRDPHAVELDKSFFEYPLWTIQKALYLFDMYDRFTRPLIVTNADGMEIQPCSTHTPELAYVDSNPSKQTDSRSHTFPPETVTWDDVRPWEWNWYQRWAVLENLVQRSDQSSPSTSSPSIEAMESSSESDSSYPCKSRSVQSTWEDGDEEEDYGTLAANCALFSKRFVDEWE